MQAIGLCRHWRFCSLAASAMANSITGQLLDFINYYYGHSRGHAKFIGIRLKSIGIPF